MFELSAAPGLADALRRMIGCQHGEIEFRQFPDGESYVRLATSVADSDVILLCTLDRPDSKILPLLFTAAAARGQGARSVGLVAPYLAYMRQDRAFHEGEAVTSTIFGGIVSEHIDWLVTIDPHLHRHRSLADIYSVPVMSASAGAAVGQWLLAEVKQPILIGPDEESRQWVDRIGEIASAPVVVLRKQRRGDRSVAIDGDTLEDLPSGTPVIVDDIAATAVTMVETVKLLKKRQLAAPICVVIHPIFAGDAYETLLREGAARVISANSISHASNLIDISDALAEAVKRIAGASFRKRL